MKNDHTNSKLERYERKLKLEKEGRIRCGCCSYHKRENAHGSQRSWKAHRSTRYKVRKDKS